MLFPAAKPLGFRKWITLENLKSKIAKGVDGNEFPDRMFDYLSTSLGVNRKRLESLSWIEGVKYFNEALQKFTIYPKIPILKDAPKDGKKDDWEYEGRDWYYYSHLLAQAYGWSLEYIADLGVDEALAHIQEVLTSHQLEMEFAYSLSELAYPYNKSTKKGEFKPMKRPYWMRPAAVEAPKKIKMRKDMLPMGRIVDVSGLPEQFAIEGLETEKPK